MSERITIAEHCECGASVLVESTHFDYGAAERILNGFRKKHDRCRESVRCQPARVGREP